jgi:hypothetical protein
MIEELELADEAIVDSSDAEHDYEEAPEDQLFTPDEIYGLRLRADEDDASARRRNAGVRTGRTGSRAAGRHARRLDRERRSVKETRTRTWNRS